MDNVGTVTLTTSNVYKMELLKDKWTCPKCQTDTQADQIPLSWLVKLLLGFLPLQQFMGYNVNASITR